MMIYMNDHPFAYLSQCVNSNLMCHHNWWNPLVVW